MREGFQPFGDVLARVIANLSTDSVGEASPVSVPMETRAPGEASPTQPIPGAREFVLETADV